MYLNLCKQYCFILDMLMYRLFLILFFKYHQLEIVYLYNIYYLVDHLNPFEHLKERVFHYWLIFKHNFEMELI